MTIDANSYCPGGTGKKIKHCECRDIVGDLEKIERAIEGEQRVAALDRINRVMATKAHRPCLLALKAGTLMDMNEMQAFEDTVTTFVKVAPHNSLAHCFAAVLEARKRRMREAIDALQSVFDYLDENIPGELPIALALVADLLVHSQEYMSGRAHGMLLGMIAPDDDMAKQIIMSLSGTTDVPLILKADRAFMDCPEGASWRGRFETAQDDAVKLRWRKALAKHEKLNEDFPQTPAILWNIALLRSLLALPHQAEAWRAFARCPGADSRQAVDAESVAQMLRYREEMPEVALMQWTVNATDANALNECLLSTPTVMSVPVDPRAEGKEGEPPPKGAFLLLDRPRLADEAEVTTESIPRRLATLLLYGRETDRPARLSAVLARTEAYASTLQRLAEIGGNLFTEEPREEVLNVVPRLAVELDPACQFPTKTRYAVRQRVSNELMQRKLLEQWPRIPMACLDGKSPAEVATDPAWRIPLEAALVGLEAFVEVNRVSADVDAVRQALGIPVPEPIVPTGKNDEISASDLVRIDPEKLSDELLMYYHGFAQSLTARAAIIKLGRELLRRRDLLPPAERCALLLELAQFVGDREAALEYVGQARKEAAAAKLSLAAPLLAELPLRLINSEVAEAQEILRILQMNHVREPGVADTIYRILREFGILRDEHVQAAMQQNGMAAEASAPAAAEAGSKLWTPDAPPPSAEGERPSKLWLPD